jgi:2-dehydro-3-deoxyphosphogluconate aldolase/(4S)-4-hydroxy-2-oxoglutarate aldolase
MSSDRSDITASLEAAGAVGIIRMKDASKLRDVAAAMVAGGMRALEVTMTTPGAVDLIRAIAPTLPADFLLGAGTVTDPDTVARVVDAGARFVVSPVFRRSVIEACHRPDVPALPGCFTPTEILDAWEAGADIVKVFPADVVGPAFFKAVRGPLPQIRLMPTGGVDLTGATSRG